VIGWVRIRESRPHPTGFEPKQIQVIKKASGYYLSISFESKEIIPDHLPGKISIGIDAGIESFIATQRELIKSPKFLRSKLRTLKLLQRRLSKKTKGSNNWLKLQRKIARFHEKVANARRDWLFKLAHYICDLADNIFVEDINFNSWARGLFGKHSLDSGIGGFINNILPYVSWKRGKYYLKINKDGTSQECSKCRRFTGKKELKQRVHSCRFCFHTESRDTNSAQIIMYRGLEAVGQTVEDAVPELVSGTLAVRSENACGLGLTGFEQTNLLELVKREGSKNPPLQRR
jgi:putative transposase